MGKKNDAIVPFFKDKVHFADFFNGALFDGESSKKLLNKFVPNYHINLINPTKTKDLSVFKSDSQLIFSMLKYKNDKEKLFRFTKDNSSYFQAVNNKTAYAIGALLDSDRLLDKILENNEKQDKDMCKALEDLYNDGVTEGMQQGVQQGAVTVLRSIGWADDAIIEKLIEVYCIDVDEAEKVLNTK